MNDQDELQRLLGPELRDRGNSLPPVNLGLDEVKRRARRIRRNRRLAAGVAVAAGLAVVVPTALTVGGALRSERGVEPAPEPDPKPTVARTTLTIEGLSRGDAPAIEYFTPDGVVLPGQGLQPLDASYQALAPSETHGGWIAMEPDRQGIRYFDEDFQPQGGSSATESFVTTPDRSWVAWVAPEAGAQTLVLRSTTDPEAGMTWDLPELPVATPVGFVAEDRVVVETTNNKGVTSVLIAEPDGSITELTGYVDAQSADPLTGRIAMQTKANEDGSGCFGVVEPDVSLDEPVWETCDHSLGAFSPDGRWVMASAAYQSGIGPASLAVLDAETGVLVADFDQSRDTQVALIQPVWETPESMVMIAMGGPITTMLRLGTDGSLEELVDPVQGDWLSDQQWYFGSDRTFM